MRRSTLGRGLASLIHEVPAPAPIEGVPYTSHGARYEHPHALTPTPLRALVREALEKLSVRPRHGLKAARAYLDKLRQAEGRTHVSLTLSGIDLTSCTMLQLKRGRIANETRYQFFGVSIWK